MQEENTAATLKHHRSEAPILGLGLGIDFEGIGISYTQPLADNVSVFAGFGYLFAGWSGSIGVMGVLPLNRKTDFVFLGMYGCNTAIYVEGGPEYNELYYGPTGGLGINMYSWRERMWSLELLVPIRDDRYDRDFRALKNNPLIEGVTEPWPVNISAGYHF